QFLFPDTPVPKRAVIAVARDEAFNFYYQDNLDLLEAQGARLAYFSPMRDGAIPAGAGLLYLGGGFPEMHAGALAANEAMLGAIRGAIRSGMPVYGECGGLMYLTEGIIGEDGTRYPMVGAVPGWCTMIGKRLHLGYVEVTSRRPTSLGPAGFSARGHEFHYSRWDGEDASTAAYTLANHDARTEGFARDNVLASFAHLHFGSNPALAPALVESAARYGEQRG
ncbi:MAG TPA: cobyrinate a,c-diamide synthase, partial [Chloroflexota bacterium]